MLTLKCTRKVQEYLGLAKSDLSETPSGDSVLGAWYVNQFTLDRRKTFIFMSERTYLSFILLGARKSNSSKALFPEMCLAAIVQLLRTMDLPLPLIGKVIEDNFESRYARTDSKKVLGNFNDLVFLYRHFVMAGGGFARCNLSDIILRINRTPQRNLGWMNSTEATLEILSAHAA